MHRLESAAAFAAALALFVIAMRTGGAFGILFALLAVALFGVYMRPAR